MNLKLLDKIVKVVYATKFVKDVIVVDNNHEPLSEQYDDCLTTSEFVDLGHDLRIDTNESTGTYINFLTPKQVQENMELAKPFLDTDKEKCAMVFTFGEVAL